MANLNFTITAGALVRGQVKREVQRYCWERDMTVDIQEAKGWFESVIKFRIVGNDKQVERASFDLRRWMKEVANDRS